MRGGGDSAPPHTVAMMNEKEHTPPMNHKFRAYSLLFLAALIWGVAFVAQDIAMDSLPPFTFNALRSLLAGLVLLPSTLRRRRKRQAPSSGKTLFIAGAACGLALFLGSGFQQLGIQQSAGPGKAGFITVLYIVLVPLTGLLWGRRVGRNVWLAVALCLVGLFLLCVTEAFEIGPGDVSLLLCAFAFTGHILVIDHFTRRVDSVGMSCVQFFVCSGLAFLTAALSEQPTWTGLADAVIPILYSGALSGAVGYTLQIAGQRDTDPTIASLILCLESVFAALAGWLILGERLSVRELVGCALMFGGIVLAQWPEKGAKKEKAAPEIL